MPVTATPTIGRNLAIGIAIAALVIGGLLGALITNVVGDGGSNQRIGFSDGRGAQMGGNAEGQGKMGPRGVDPDGHVVERRTPANGPAPFDPERHRPRQRPRSVAPRSPMAPRRARRPPPRRHPPRPAPRDRWVCPGSPDAGDPVHAQGLTNVHSYPSPPGHACVVAGLLALGLVGALSLQACGSSGSSSSSDTTTADGSTTTTVVNTTSLDGVTVEGDFGSKPTVTFDPSYVGTEDSSKVLIEGDGPVVTADQRVTADYLGVGGADGTELGGTFGSKPDNFFMADKSLRPVIVDAMVGKKVGSRVVIAVDATASGGQWNIVVFDIRDADTIPMSAEGEAVNPTRLCPR